jgi:prepilin-type N-terminal cleavage/methylation domain-containing protein
MKRNRSFSCGFTIVELLVVIVIIGILAAITIVSYVGITNRAITASLQSDLSSAANQLKQYQVVNMAYPTSLDCSSSPAANSICLKASNGNSLNYQVTTTASPQSFELYDTNNTTNYVITDSSSVAKTNLTTPCPTGFIPVPGSSTYGTSDFCVMKYEAKIQGNDWGNQTYSSSFVPESRATGTPWTSISQTNAIAEAQTVPGCTGCHLITEAEWMTIAQNVLNVAGNWSGNAVGSGDAYSGHNNESPHNTLATNSNDNNGYVGENTDGNNFLTQKRTLTLTNGQIIWDLAGNVWEWTSSQITGNQPGHSDDNSYSWRDYDDSSLLQNSFPSNSLPSSTGINGINRWDSNNHTIGQIYSNYSEITQRGFLRGGSWGYYGDVPYWCYGGCEGVLELYLGRAPSYSDEYIGFRVSR